MRVPWVSDRHIPVRVQRRVRVSADDHWGEVVQTCVRERVGVWLAFCIGRKLADE